MSDLDVYRLVTYLTEVLGPPIATPLPARYRVWRWDCPRCFMGRTDPDGIWLPFSLDSEGRLMCNACHASEEHLVAAIKRLDPGGPG